MRSSHYDTVFVSREPVAGWLGVAAIALAYVALFVANLWLPLDRTSYVTRIWGWSQLALTAAAAVVLVLKPHLTARTAAFGLGLAVLSGLSHALHDLSVLASVLEGLAAFLCFAAGMALFADGSTPTVPAFRSPLAAIGRSIALGILLAVPLAVVNNAFFYLQAGSPHFRSGLLSALEALSPAIHEEIVFRFFILALCLGLLKSSPSRRIVMATAVTLAVVPHSLNHLPDLFLQNPPMALFMLVGTCLLFGLPMALLQIKRNLEAAVAFHWFIDFARFLFGF